MYDVDKGIQFLRVLSLEKTINELMQQENLELQEQILSAKLKMLQEKFRPKLTLDELEDLRLRVDTLEIQVQRLEKRIEDENILPVREKYLLNRIRQLTRAKEKPVETGESSTPESL
jgi:hypothetical protein